MNPKSDEDLVRDIQNGDIFAFEGLVKRYQQRLLAFCRRILNDEFLAEEVVQDSLFKIYTTIERIDTSRRFSVYVFEIAKNRAISVLRSQRKNVSLEDIVLASEDATFYEQIAQSEDTQKVRQAINKLNDNYRKVINLYYLQDLSYEEIQKVLKIPLNTVRTHLRRAREALRKVLENEIS